MNAAAERYRAFLEALAPDTLERLGEHVARDVRFADPFNDVIGQDGMARVFRHMFEAVGPVTFTVTHCACDGDMCLMAWRFEARLRGRPWAFDGTSTIRFDPDSGKVVEHIDHWDAARAFYERLPVIAWPLAAIRRRLAVNRPTRRPRPRAADPG